MGTTASSCIQTRCFQSSLSFSLPPVCLKYTVKDLPTLLHLHHPLHLSTQHHLQFSIIIQTLARPMLGVTASTRTPTATRWRRSSSRTSASHTLRRPETCQPELFKNCTGVIKTNIERVCFKLNELVCNLVEAVHYETLEETYQVQRCFTGKDGVCDTTYDIDTTTKDDYQCCNVETPNCYMEEKTINDVTCTNTVEFNCKREKTTKNDGYGQKEVVCTRTPKQ